jgi:ribosome-associated protein
MRQRSKPAPQAEHALNIAAAPEYQFERPSKTRLKQQAHDLQALGQALVELPPSRLKDVPMPEGLRDAIAEYRRTKSFEGKRRQLQYVGKQMRFADPGPLQEAVDAFRLGSAKDTLMLHQVELWRDELVANDEAATRWAAEYPGSDLQQLRSLVRAARKDAAAAPEQRNGRGYRELFQFIKPWLADAAGQSAHPAADDDEPEDE